MIAWGYFEWGKTSERRSGPRGDKIEEKRKKRLRREYRMKCSLQKCSSADTFRLTFVTITVSKATVRLNLLVAWIAFLYALQDWREILVTDRQKIPVDGEEKVDQLTWPVTRRKKSERIRASKKGRKACWKYLLLFAIIENRQLNRNLVIHFSLSLGLWRWIPFYLPLTVIHMIPLPLLLLSPLVSLL